MTIAGHSFDSNDVCTAPTHTTVDGVAVAHACGKRWTDIMHCDESCVGQVGWAHTADLRDYELKEIVKERERRERLYEAATKGVSGGGDVAAVPVEQPPVQPDTMMCYPASVYCEKKIDPGVYPNILRAAVPFTKDIVKEIAKVCQASLDQYCPYSRVASVDLDRGCLNVDVELTQPRSEDMVEWLRQEMEIVILKLLTR